MPYVTLESYARVRAIFDRLIHLMNDGQPYPKSIALTPSDVALIDTLETLGKLP